MRQSLASAFSVIVPGDCRICDHPLLDADPYPVCRACLGGISPIHHATCSLCADALDAETKAEGRFGRHPMLCDSCLHQPPAFIRAASFGSYGGALRRLIHLYKFDHMRQLSQPLAVFLAAAIESLQPAPAIVTVVAVPLHVNARPFNQSSLVADCALRLLQKNGGAGSGWECRHNLLERVRRTESQSHLTPRQRYDNVRGAFRASPDVKGRHLLLVDDVYTTGATAKECTRVLLAAGAESVRVATLARAHADLVTAWRPGFAESSKVEPVKFGSEGEEAQ